MLCVRWGVVTRGPHWLYTWMPTTSAATLEQSFSPKAKHHSMGCHMQHSPPQNNRLDDTHTQILCITKLFTTTATNAIGIIMRNHVNGHPGRQPRFMHHNALGLPRPCGWHPCCYYSPRAHPTFATAMLYEDHVPTTTSSFI